MKKLLSHYVNNFVFIAFFLISQPLSAGELVIEGTGSGLILLKKLGSAFTDKNPEVKIILPPSRGSGGGIRAVGKNEIILGRTARRLMGKEKKFGLKELMYARMPIVFFVNKTLQVSDITPFQLCKIYEGKIREWGEIGRAKGLIRVIKREEGDSSLLVIRRAVPGFLNLILTPRAKTCYSDQETIKACLSEKNSIAFGDMVNIKNESRLKPLKISGLHPSMSEYPYYGALYLIYKEKNYRGNLKKFVEFILSPEAVNIIIESGGLPVE